MMNFYPIKMLYMNIFKKIIFWLGYNHSFFLHLCFACVFIIWHILKSSKATKRWFHVNFLFSVTQREIRIFLRQLSQKEFYLKLLFSRWRSCFIIWHGWLFKYFCSHVTPSILSLPLMPFCLGWQLVSEEMDSGFLESLGSVPTGGRAGAGR